MTAGAVCEALNAISGFDISNKLPQMNILVTIDTAERHLRKTEGLACVLVFIRLMTIAAFNLKMPSFQIKSGLRMIECDSSPTLDAMAILAAIDAGEFVNFSAVRI